MKHDDKHWTSKLTSKSETEQSSAPATASFPFILIYFTSLSVLLLITTLFVLIITHPKLYNFYR